MSGSPAAASNVGSMSWWETMPFSTVPALILPGQRRNAGTRQAPSQLVSFWLRNGVLARIGPGVVLRAVVGGIHDDGVIGDAQFIELVEHLADLLVVGDHPIAVIVLPALSAVLVGEVGPEVHRSRVVPEEEGLVRLGLLLHPAESGRRDLLIDSFHALLGKWTGVLDGLLSDSSPPGFDGRVILVRCDAVKNAARPELSP